MAKRTKKSKWFIKVRGSYLPNNWQGWLTYIPFVGYLVYSAIVEWQYNSHTRAILLIGLNWIAATVVMTWIAKRNS